MRATLHTPNPNFRAIELCKSVVLPFLVVLEFLVFSVLARIPWFHLSVFASSPGILGARWGFKIWKSKFLYRYRPEGIFRIFFGLILDPPPPVHMLLQRKKANSFAPAIFFPHGMALLEKRGGLVPVYVFIFPENPCFFSFVVFLAFPPPLPPKKKGKEGQGGYSTMGCSSLIWWGEGRPGRFGDSPGVFFKHRQVTDLDVTDLGVFGAQDSVLVARYSAILRYYSCYTPL